MLVDNLNSRTKMKRIVRSFLKNKVLTLILLMAMPGLVSAQGVLSGSTVEPDTVEAHPANDITLLIESNGIPFEQGSSTLSDCSVLNIENTTDIVVTDGATPLTVTSFTVFTTDTEVYDSLQIDISVPLSTPEGYYHVYLQPTQAVSCDTLIEDSFYVAQPPREFNLSAVTDTVYKRVSTVKVESPSNTFANSEASCITPTCIDLDSTLAYFYHTVSSDSIPATGMLANNNIFTVDFDLTGSSPTGDWNFVLIDTTLASPTKDTIGPVTVLAHQLFSPSDIYAGTGTVPDTVQTSASETRTLDITVSGALFTQGTSVISCDTLNLPGTHSIIVETRSGEQLDVSSYNLVFGQVPEDTLSIEVNVPIGSTNDYYHVYFVDSNQNTCPDMIEDSIYVKDEPRTLSPVDSAESTQFYLYKGSTGALTVQSTGLKLTNSGATCESPYCIDVDSALIYLIGPAGTDSVYRSAVSANSDGSFDAYFSVPPGASAGDWSMVLVDTTAGTYTYDTIAPFRVLTPLAITDEPIDQYASGTTIQRYGESFGFQVTVGSGQSPYAYQWYKNGTAMASEQSSTLSFSSLGFDDNGGYTCEITDAYGTSYTSQQVILLISNPVISDTLMSDESFVVSVPGNFWVIDTNNLGYKYYWTVTSTHAQEAVITDQYNDTAQITFPAAGTYTVSVVKYDIDSAFTGPPMSKEVTVVETISFVNTNDTSLSLCEGDTIKYTMEVNGTPESYRWEYSGSSGVFGESPNTVSGQTTKVLAIPNAEYDKHQGAFRCVAILPEGHPTDNLVGPSIDVDVKETGLEEISVTQGVYFDEGDTIKMETNNLRGTFTVDWEATNATLVTNEDEAATFVAGTTGTSVVIEATATKYGCSKTVSLTMGTVGLDVYYDEEGAYLTPNPASETCQLVLPQSTGLYTIDILNMNGQIVKSMSAADNTVGLPVNELTSGMYVVVVKGQYNYQLKLIVE